MSSPISGLELRMQGQQQSDFAELGAQRLEGLGPDGARWAQAFRRNPAATIAMAEQYGGMAQIELGLRNAMAQGAAAGRRQATTEDLRALVTQGAPASVEENVLNLMGPAGFAQYGTGQAGIGSRTVDEADAYATRRETDAVWGPPAGAPVAGTGVAPAPAAGGPGGGRNLNDLELRLAMASGDPTKIRAARDRSLYGPGQSEDSIRALRKERLGIPGIAELGTQLAQYHRFQALDLDNPVSDVGLIQIAGKMLDPNSVVREQEAAMIGAAGASTIGEVMLKLGNIVRAGGVIPAEAKYYLARMIEDLHVGNMESARMWEDTWNQQNQEWGLGQLGSRQSMPFAGLLDRAAEIQPRDIPVPPGLQVSTDPALTGGRPPGAPASREEFEAAKAELAVELNMAPDEVPMDAIVERLER